MMRPPSLPVPPNVCPYCTAGDADAVGINRNATSAAATKMALLLRKTPPPREAIGSRGISGFVRWQGKTSPDECSHGSTVGGLAHRSQNRSEERRVGKECIQRWSQYDEP